MLTFPGKIPIRVHPMFWLLAAMIGWVNSQDFLGTLLWVVIITISILVHEFGHALSALYFGQTAEIELIMLGGLTQRTGPRLKLWQEFAVILNGPLAGFALGLIAFFLAKKISPSNSPILHDILSVTWFVNIFWTIFNLLPVHPLDGGKLLNILLEAVFGLRGIKVGYFISIGLSLLLAIAFFYIHSFIAGSLFLLFSFENYRAWQASLSMTHHDQDADLQKALEDAEVEMKNGNYDHALNLLQTIQASAKNGYIHLIALQNQASILAHQQLYPQAYDLLNSVYSKLTIEGQQLFQMICYKSGKWQEAIAMGNKAYQAQPYGETALINAICHAKLGEVKPTIGWLQNAFNTGISNIKEVLQSPEFDHVRQDPTFQGFCKNVVGNF